MDASEFHRSRKFVETPSGRIAYVELGSGPAAVFVHGAPLNGFIWRHAMADLSGLRRCIALDLMGLGYTEVPKRSDVSPPAQAEMIGQFVDALGLGEVDLVANDSGGAVAQIFAARYPQRLRSLTLTNCDVNDHWPEGIDSTVDSARAGTLADGLKQLMQNGELARQIFSTAYAKPEALTDEAIKVYFEPITLSEGKASLMHEFWLGLDPAHLTAIEPALRELTVPTLLVWAKDDTFFPLKCAHWLRDAVPGVVDLIEVPDAKLFFPDDRPEALSNALADFWRAD